MFIYGQCYSCIIAFCWGAQSIKNQIEKRPGVQSFWAFWGDTSDPAQNKKKTCRNMQKPRVVKDSMGQQKYQKNVAPQGSKIVGFMGPAIWFSLLFDYFLCFFGFFMSLAILYFGFHVSCMCLAIVSCLFARKVQILDRQKCLGGGAGASYGQRKKQHQHCGCCRNGPVQNPQWGR